MELPVTTTAKLQMDQTRRVAEACQQSAQLALHPPTPDAWAEMFELALAAQGRLADLNRQVLADWWRWGEYAGSIEGADTVPKFADRTGNIALQAQALTVSHISQFAALMDNVGISYAYWVDQQVQREQ